MEIVEITSVKNDLIKEVVKLQNSRYRKNKKLILADGDRTLEGFINDNIEFEYFFTKKENFNHKKAKIKNLIYVNDSILSKISTTKTPTNAIGIIKEPDIDKNIFYSLSKIALIENIKDPGNLGTIIRSACAFSLEGIILFGNCVDLYNSKTIRSTTQNIFKLPIIQTCDYQFLHQLKKTHKFISSVVDSNENFFNYKFDNKFVLMLGSESCGLSEEIKKIADKKLTFLMDNNVESLNLGICASIAFALIKQQEILNK